MVKYYLLQLLIDLLLLSQDHIAFAFDRGGVKLRVLKDIADYVHSYTNVLLEALRVVYSLLTGRISIQVSPEILNFKLQSVLGTSVGTLERHMFEKVSSPIRRIRFGT